MAGGPGRGPMLLLRDQTAGIVVRLQSPVQCHQFLHGTLVPTVGRFLALAPQAADKTKTFD